MKQIGIKTYYLLFIYNFFFKYFVKGADPCNPPKFIAKEDESSTTYECLYNTEECSAFGYIYYNSYENKCWKNGCPSSYYTNEMDTVRNPMEDISGNTCVKVCSQTFPKYKDGEKICKKNCDVGEVYTIDEPNKCKSENAIDKSIYPYVSEKDLNLYLKECHYEKFIVENGGKKICVSNCKEYNKYFILGEQSCLNGCNITYPYVNTDNQCLKICTDNKYTYYIYSKPTDSIPRKCYEKSEIDASTQCFYDSNKIIYPRSGQTFFSQSDNQLCYPVCKREYLRKIGGTTNQYYCISACTTSEYKNSITINGNYYTECVTSCSYRINGRSECLNACPANYLVYVISGQNICYDANCIGTQKYDVNQKQCTDVTGGKYKYDSALNLYVWTANCIAPTKYIKDTNDKECVSNCPEGNNYLKGDTQDIICQKNCEDEYYIKDGSYFICKGTSCPSGYYTFYDQNGLPRKLCSPTGEDPVFNYIVTTQTYNRYSVCPSTYLFYLKSTDGKYKTCNETNPCSGTNYYFEGECLTGTQCAEKNKLYVESQQCVDQCLSTNQYKKFADGIYLCGEKTICNGMYIDSGNYCVSKCPKERNFIRISDNTCMSKCNDGEYYYYKEDGTDATYKIYQCDTGCPSTYSYKGQNTQECFNDCRGDLKYKSESEKKCYNNCTFSNNPFTLGNSCTQECDNTYKFYYEKEKVCLSNCNPEDYGYSTNDQPPFLCIRDCAEKNKKFYENYNGQNINICVSSCTGGKKFINGVYCANQCPNEKKFFVQSTSNVTCLIDCPSGKPYYEIRSEGNECLSSCNTTYYGVINDKENKLIAKQCLSSCPSGNYKYIGKSSGTKKECVVVCPSDIAYHHYNGTTCIIDCPTSSIKYREINSTVCITESQCSNKYVDFETKLCLSKDQVCPKERTYTTYPRGLNKIICSNTCYYKFNDIDYNYSTPYKTCVDRCTDIPEMHFNKTNYFNSDCFCKNLYFINNSIEVNCIASTEKKCKKVSSTHPINLVDDYIGSKECVSTCNGSRVLNLKEDTCHLGTYNCTEPEDNYTVLIRKTSDQRKCDCRYRFYYELDNEILSSLGTKIIKKCLNESAKCHDVNKNRYAPETKECTKDECPKEHKYEFQNYFCLRSCPKDSILETTGGKSICKCVSPKKFWHKISSGNFECLDTCHDKYPVYAPYNNRCLKNCKNSYFPVFYENKCFKSCDNNPDLNIVNANLINETGGDLYNQTCRCPSNKTWYRNESKVIICSNNIDCKSFVNPTREFKYLIYDTMECVDECPDAYPYFFNEGCFKNCSHASKVYSKEVTNFGTFECQCATIWYNKTSGDVSSKICINQTYKECYEFSDTLKYKINKTNECVEKCPDEMYIINYTCYENCPEYTKDNERDKNCFCNTNMGFWYEYEKTYHSKNYYFIECGVDGCPYNISDKTSIEPYTRQYLLKSKKKCLKNCSDDEEYPFNYQNICIKTCPYYTNIINNGCILFDLNDTDITTREQLRGATNVQVLELYYNLTETINQYKDEFFFDRFNAKIHIYGIDRDNSYKDKIDFTLDKYKDLTYIDLGSCINKLFLDKNISENEQILIVKYDILNETSYMINRVEYELFSNNTNEKLDALVCDPYEILVSYPLFLNRFDDFEGTDNNNEYLEKFKIGKELYKQDNTINTFDYNSFIYKNFCRGLEYKGKDLVFEDRYKNLYPNNILLCENNCTINNTDFENQRINCLCTYKNDFDFDRKEEVDDIFNNPNFYIPTQSPANAEAIKCLFNFTVKQAIATNVAFYYCFAIAAAEIALALISSIIGINTITNYIKPILNKIQSKDFRKKSKAKKNIGFKTDNIITSTNRPLNNPPKKTNIYKEGDYEIDSEDGKNNNDSIFENDLDSNDHKEANYEINIKKSNNKISKNDNYYKAEYIPQEYSSKFFKSTDKGVIKKIDRSKLPFKIGKDTKLLLEKKNDIEYDSNYLDGQYSPSQNILIITDGANTNITNVVKYLKTEKLIDNKLTTKTDMKGGDKRLFGNINTYYSKNTDKDLITVKKLKSNFAKPKFEEEGISEIFDEDSDDMKVDEESAGLFTLIRREQLFLRLEYKKYLEKKHPNNLAIILSEILDKIYIIKIILFLRKYDIFTHQLSLYLFCHILLMSLLCGFFTIRVIKKIWDQDGYPGIGFYLLYGLISNIIIWIIYQIFLFIIDFRDKIKEIVLLQNELKQQESNDYDDNIDERNEKIFKKKYNQIISNIKCIIIVFYIIIFIIILFCTIYLISFFALYTGTRNLVLQSYIYSIIEILIIKFVYGFCLALLRTASRINKMEKVYKIVYIFDKYIS